MRLQSEDGTWMEIAVVQSNAPMKSTPLDVDSRFRDPAADAKGRGATFRSQKEPRVKVYRGSVETLVASSQAGFLLSQGFTASPTATTPPPSVPCGVDTLDGGVCGKVLVNERERINHIRISHGDVAPWLLSDEDMLKARGKVILGGRASAAPDPRVSALEAKVDELIRALNKSAAPSIATTIVEDLKSELDVLKAGADEFMKEGVEEEVAATPPVTMSANGHTCKLRGRFGKITDGCPACEVKKNANESNPIL